MTENKWEAAAGAQFSNEDAQRYGPRITEMEAKHGYVQPDMIIREARDTESPLHDAFEWDDPQAAHAYRLVQARNLMNHLCVLVEFAETPKQVKAFYNVRLKKGDDSGETIQAYVGAVEVSDSAAHRAELLKQAVNEIVRWRKRYKELQELKAIFVASELVQQRLRMSA